jgi:hypothetical protein
MSWLNRMYTAAFTETSVSAVEQRTSLENPQTPLSW